MTDLSAEQNTMRDLERDVCPRCKCCSLLHIGESCWYCVGAGEFDEYDDDPINYAPGEVITGCPECGGTGEITITRCIGECDENGKHTHSVLSKVKS